MLVIEVRHNNALGLEEPQPDALFVWKIVEKTPVFHQTHRKLTTLKKTSPGSAEV